MRAIVALPWYAACDAHVAERVMRLTDGNGGMPREVGVPQRLCSCCRVGTAVGARIKLIARNLVGSHSMRSKRQEWYNFNVRDMKTARNGAGKSKYWLSHQGRCNSPPFSCFSPMTQHWRSRTGGGQVRHEYRSGLQPKPLQL